MVRLSVAEPIQEGVPGIWPILLAPLQSNRQATPAADRVLIAQGKPQRYGSQFTAAGDGTMELRPTEDMDGLDARRQAMGLQPLAQYKAVLSEAYRKPVR